MAWGDLASAFPGPEFPPVPLQGAPPQAVLGTRVEEPVGVKGGAGTESGFTRGAPQGPWVSVEGKRLLSGSLALAVSWGRCAVSRAPSSTQIRGTV